MISNVLVSYTYSPVGCDSMEKELKFSAAVNVVGTEVFQCRVTFASRVLNSISHYDFSRKSRELGCSLVD